MKKARIAINGFGRIGRQVFRAVYAKYRNTAEVVAINDLYDEKINFHLLEYDTCYGRSDFTPEVNEHQVRVGDWRVTNLKEQDPSKLPWKDLDIDVVVESTGAFRTADEARVHITNGAKRVIITAPAKGEDLSIMMGVNHQSYDPAKHFIISNASCTTNCLAPAAYIMHKHFGIAQGIMTTIHSYTNDQRILDLPHKDLRRARAAACNIIPTSTGAAEAVGKIIPALEGKFSGYSLRVPTPTVSIVDFTAILEKDTDTQTLRNALKEAANGELKGIMQYNALPLVSSDFKGNPHSSIVDEEYTFMTSPKVAKLVAWYDNEWGYSNRVADVINTIHQKKI